MHSIGNYSLQRSAWKLNHTAIHGTASLSIVRSHAGFSAVPLTPPRDVVYRGFPAPGLACFNPDKACVPLRFNGAFVLRLSDGKGWLCSAMAWWADRHGFNTSRPNINAVVTLRSDDGYAWTYAGEVATALGLPRSEEGPSESSLAELSDGRIACVLRTDGGDGAPHHAHQPYAIAFSPDLGVSWTKPRMLPAGVGSALPRLLLLHGVLLLAGGRPSGSSYDPKLWIDRTSGEGSGPWEEHSVSAAHNEWLEEDAQRTNGSTPLPWWAARPGQLAAGRADLPGWPKLSNLSAAEAACEASSSCVGLSYKGSASLAPNETALIYLKSEGSADADGAWTTLFKPAVLQPFDRRVNSSDFPRQSTAYTALLRTGERSACLVYDQWLHHMGNTWRVYAMRVDV